MGVLKPAASAVVTGQSLVVAGTVPLSVPPSHVYTLHHMCCCCPTGCCPPSSRARRRSPSSPTLRRALGRRSARWGDSPAARLLPACSDHSLGAGACPASKRVMLEMDARMQPGAGHAPIPCSHGSISTPAMCRLPAAADACHLPCHLASSSRVQPLHLPWRAACTSCCLSPRSMCPPSCHMTHTTQQAHANVC